MAEAPTKKRRTKQANGNGGGRYRTDKGIWEWRHTTPDGRRFSGYAKTQVDAKARCMAKVRQAEKGIDVNATKQKLSGYLEWWLTDVVDAKNQASTAIRYRDLVRLHIVPDLGATELGKLTPQQVQSLMRKKEREGLSPRTVAGIRALLRNALNVALKMQLIERNAAALTDAPRQVRKEIHPLTTDQVRELLQVVEGTQYEVLYRTTVSLGLRMGEALGLRWQDLDLERGSVRIRQTAIEIRGLIVFKEPKTDRSRRTIALPPSVVKALRAHRDRQAWDRKRAGALWHDLDLVFTTGLGNPLFHRNVLARFKRDLGAAGLPDQRFHDLRHCAATFLIAEGTPITEVSQMLGHSMVSTTLNVYAHVLPEAQRRTADTMERLLG